MEQLLQVIYYVKKHFNLKHCMLHAHFPHYSCTMDACSLPCESHHTPALPHELLEGRALSKYETEDIYMYIYIYIRMEESERGIKCIASS